MPSSSSFLREGLEAEPLQVLTLSIPCCMVDGQVVDAREEGVGGGGPAPQLVRPRGDRPYDERGARPGEDRPQRHWRALARPEPRPAARSWYTRSTWLVTVSQVKRERTLLRPAHPSRSRRPVSASSVAMAAAVAPASCGGTNRPSRPWSITHSTAPVRAPITGLLHAHASRYTMPNDSTTDGIARTSSAPKMEALSASAKPSSTIPGSCSSAESAARAPSTFWASGERGGSRWPASSRVARGIPAQTVFMARVTVTTPLDS